MNAALQIILQGGSAEGSGNNSNIISTEGDFLITTEGDNLVWI